MWGELRVALENEEQYYFHTKSKSFIHSGTTGLGIQDLQCFDHPNILGHPLEYPKGTNGSVRESSKSRFFSPGAHEMTKKSLSRDSLGFLFLVKKNFKNPYPDFENLFIRASVAAITKIMSFYYTKNLLYYFTILFYNI